MSVHETSFTTPDQPDIDTTDLVGDDTSLSGLEALRIAATTEVDKPRVFPIRTRPDFSLRCRVNVTAAELRKWAKQATNKVTKDTDPVMESRLILANTTLAILHKGQPILGHDREPVTFSSEDFRDSMGVMPGEPVVAGIAKFIPNDGDTTSLALAVQWESGFGQSVSVEDEPDPTRRGT